MRTTESSIRRPSAVLPRLGAAVYRALAWGVWLFFVLVVWQLTEESVIY